MTAPDPSPAAGKTPLVSIVLVNYRTPAMTLDCVASLQKHCRAVPHEIIVADNGSGDDSLPVLEQARQNGGPPLVLEPMPVNLGFGAGCNAGARRAKGKYIYLLNTDTLMEGDSVKILAEFLENHPGAAAVGSRLRRPDGTLQRAAFYFPTPLRILLGAENLGEALEKRLPALQTRLSMYIPEERLGEPRRVDWCSGASLMVRAAAYHAIGGFDEAYFLYAEEIDLCRRLLPYGETWFTPDTTVVHLEGASHRDGTISDRRMGFMAAGRRLYYRKHCSLPARILCHLADGGGAAAKGAVLWLAALWNRNPATRHRAKAQFAYARNYYTYSYPLPAAGKG